MAHSNEEWIAALSGRPSEAHVEELRRIVRSGLARALSQRASVDDHDLDDFTQEGLTRILASLDSFRGKSRFTTWAMSIAIRAAFTELRRERWGDVSLEALELPPRGAAAHPPTDTAERDEIIEALRRAIDRDLTDKQRTVILAELAGMPSAVLVDQMDTNPNALYKLYHDARRRLKKALEDAGFSHHDVESSTP